MTKLNKKLEYALMALKYFAHSNVNSDLPAKASAKQIAEATHAPYEITARVLQTLSSKGLLKAEYGTQGGYSLSQDLEQISVHDLMEMIDGSTELTKCISSSHECELSKKCTIVSPVQNLNLKVKNFYKSISLKEILHAT